MGRDPMMIRGFFRVYGSARIMRGDTFSKGCPFWFYFAISFKVILNPMNIRGNMSVSQGVMEKVCGGKECGEENTSILFRDCNCPRSEIILVYTNFGWLLGIGEIVQFKRKYLLCFSTAQLFFFFIHKI